MEVRVLEEAGFYQALFGLGLSHGITSDCEQPHVPEETMNRLEDIALALAGRDGGHNKFLESIQLWIDVRAPRYWWQEFDTYRIGVTKQSESTMHTLTKRNLKQGDFVRPIPSRLLEELNTIIRRWQTAREVELCPEIHFEDLKTLLPEGFLQRRIICLNYKVLRGIYGQRRNHKLKEWQVFLQRVLEQVAYPMFITKTRKDRE